MALVSAAVVASLVAYAITTPSFELQAAVTDVQEHASREAIVHGRVLEADGDAVSRAEVRVLGAAASRPATRTGEQGYFRLDVAGPCADRTIVISVRAPGKARTTLERRLCPGDAIELAVRIVATGQFVWLPTR